MSATWYLYSPLPPKAMTELETLFEEHLEAYAADHEDAFDDEDLPPEVSAGGLMPPPKELQALYTHLRLTLPPAILARYKACKSVLTLDQPGDINESRALVSTLRFLLSRTGDGALLFQNDVPLVPAEEILADLLSKRGLPGFDDKPKAKKAPARGAAKRETREEKPGEVRAVRVAQALEALMNDPELALDLRSALKIAPTLAQKYAALLLEEGAMPDARAAKLLGTSVETLASAADGLDQVLIELRE